MPAATIHHSVSTWRQSAPPPASAARSALISQLAEAITSRGPGRLRVAVDGRTAAGKTSFGHELAGAIAARSRPVLRASLDDFKRPWRDRHLYDRESGEGYYRNAFDYERVRTLLLAPFERGACALCAIDPRTQIDHADELTEAGPSAILLVDGVFAFRPELNRWWDYRVWLEISPQLSVSRGLARDGGDGSVLTERYLVSENIYLAEENPVLRADAVIDNSDLRAPRFLRGGPVTG
jgi:uridine kinase